VRQLRLLVLLSWPWNAGIDLYSISVFKQKIFKQNMVRIGRTAVSHVSHSSSLNCCFPHSCTRSLKSTEGVNV